MVQHMAYSVRDMIYGIQPAGFSSHDPFGSPCSSVLAALTHSEALDKLQLCVKSSCDALR